MLTKNNNKLVSTNLSESQVLDLYNKKYNLTEFDIYKYIIALDYIIDSLGCIRDTLTEGISQDKNKYNNILIDLFYQNLDKSFTSENPISVVFGIKDLGQGVIRDLTILEKQNNLFLSDYEASESFAMNYWTEEYELFKSEYKNYSGNSYTYFIFKLLIKLFLTEVYLYSSNGQIWTYKELIDSYQIFIIKHPNPLSVKPLNQKILDGDIEKIKYSCIKVVEPCDINHFSLLHLKLKLLNINTSDNQASDNIEFIQENKFK